LARETRAEELELWLLGSSSAQGLRRLKRQDRNLRRAIEAEGKTYCADAAVDVELHIIEAVVSFRIFFAHWRQNERPQKGKPYLAAVGVSGEHEIDKMASGMGSDVIGVVGFMCHEDYRSIGFGRKS
jgi:hypothetical protein